MLGSLSGQTHTVFTGVTLVTPAADAKAADQTPTVRCFYESSAVTFDALTPAMIKAYVDSKEPMDKAGGYGIQVPQVFW